MTIFKSQIYTSFKIASLVFIFGLSVISCGKKNEDNSAAAAAAAVPVPTSQAAEITNAKDFSETIKEIDQALTLIVDVRSNLAAVSSYPFFRIDLSPEVTTLAQVANDLNDLKSKLSSPGDTKSKVDSAQLILQGSTNKIKTVGETILKIFGVVKEKKDLEKAEKYLVQAKEVVLRT